jgi:hypothetical protein
VADDILDAYHDPDAAGKTLGTDVPSGRLTAVTAADGSSRCPLECIRELLDSSAGVLDDRPEFCGAWRQYIEEDIGPAIRRLTSRFESEAALV